MNEIMLISNEHGIGLYEHMGATRFKFIAALPDISVATKVGLEHMLACNGVQAEIAEEGLRDAIDKVKKTVSAVKAVGKTVKDRATGKSKDYKEYEIKSDRELKDSDLNTMRGAYQFQNKRLGNEHYRHGGEDRLYDPAKDGFTLPRFQVVNYFNTKYSVLHYGPSIQRIVGRKYETWEHVWVLGFRAIAFVWDTREVTDEHKLNLEQYKALLFDIPAQIKDSYEALDNFSAFNNWAKFCDYTNDTMRKVETLRAEADKHRNRMNELVRGKKQGEAANAKKVYEQAKERYVDELYGYDAQFRKLNLFK